MPSLVLIEKLIWFSHIPYHSYSSFFVKKVIFIAYHSVQHTFVVIYVQLKTTVFYITDHAYPSLHVCQILPYYSLQPHYHLFHLPISCSHLIYYHYYLVQSVMFHHIRKVKGFTLYFLFCSFCWALFLSIYASFRLPL
jgi:hypothetical protein